MVYPFWAAGGGALATIWRSLCPPCPSVDGHRRLASAATVSVRVCFRAELLRVVLQC